MKSLEKLYTSFESSDVAATKQLLGRAALEDSAENRNIFSEIVSLLYPTPAGSFLHGQHFWDRLKELMKMGSKSTGTDAEKIFSKLFRIYYVNLGSPDADPLENNIRDFYKKNRPSAVTGYSWQDENQKYVENASLRDQLSIDSYKLRTEQGKNASLMYVLVDSPSIDIKMRNANKAEVFLNYIPSIVASQMTPYFSAEFSLTRNVEGGDPQASSRRPLGVMSPLRFLMGGIEPSSGTPDAMMYDAAIQRKINPGRRDWNIEETIRQRNATRAKAKPPQPPLPVPTESPQVSAGTSVTTTGMEMFTMPQTLINMDYSQTDLPRYHPVLNPVLPFGTILSFTMNVTPSVGIMSFKTASMTLKIFDKSRLAEIADFLNPKLYQSATVWVTYGWIAPTTYGREFGGRDVGSYFDFINDNMIRREAYGVRNTGMNIENDGSVTVTLSLYTKSAQNVLEATDIESAAYEVMQHALGDKLQKLSSLAKKLGLQSFVDLGPDVRGNALISSAISGNLTTFDSKDLELQLNAVTKALSVEGKMSPLAKEFVATLSSVYKQAGTTPKGGQAKLAIVEQLESVAGQLATNRFVKAYSHKCDLFSDRGDGGKDAKVVKYKPNDEPSPFTRLNKYTTDITSHPKTGGVGAKIDRNSAHHGPFGATSFGHIFAHYFSEIAQNLASTDMAEEFQVIFYNLNDEAGLVGGINIAEFPIDASALEAAYSKKVSDQKGERMSMDMFLDVVRQSQFGDIRHGAYGFRDLYKIDKGELVLNDAKKEDMTKRLMGGAGRGPFTLPSIEYLIETGHSAIASSTQYANDAIEGLSSNDPTRKPGSQTRIVRIHIYDKASSPHKLVSRIFKHPNGFVEVDDEYMNSKLSPMKDDIAKLEQLQASIKALTNEEKAAAAADPIGFLAGANSRLNLSLQTYDPSTGGTSPTPNPNKAIDASKAYRIVTLKGNNSGAPTFEKLKSEVARLVPTLRIGTNGTMIQNVSYSTNQDALLSTIMMLRNTGGASNPSQPNGSADGMLPLRVVSGQLSVTTFGCPLVEYMQQFFVDLGTGTTIDNLYNITGLTHNITPGKFSTEIKFTFADAYGQYESAQDLIDGTTAKIGTMVAQAQLQKAAKEKPGGK